MNPYPGRIVKATSLRHPDADGSIVSAGERAEREFLTHCKRWYSRHVRRSRVLQRTTEGAGDLPNLSAANPTSFGNVPAATKLWSEQTLQFLADVACDAAALRADGLADDTVAFRIAGSGTNNSEAEKTRFLHFRLTMVLCRKFCPQQRLTPCSRSYPGSLPFTQSPIAMDVVMNRRKYARNHSAVRN